METPLHPTPMQRPMMKGEIYVDELNKPTFQGIWGMTHADVNKNGLTNDFKVVRMESVKEQERGLPVFPGNYLGYFKLTTGFQTETVNDSFTLTFREHSNHGYNVYGFGENRFGKTEIVGTVTQTGKMEIFKMIPGMTVQPRLANARAVSLPPPPPIARPLVGSSRAGHSAGGARPKPSGSAKKKPQKEPLPPPPLDVERARRITAEREQERIWSRDQQASSTGSASAKGSEHDGSTSEIVEPSGCLCIPPSRKRRRAAADDL